MDRFCGSDKQAADDEGWWMGRGKPSAGGMAAHRRGKGFLWRQSWSRSCPINPGPRGLHDLVRGDVNAGWIGCKPGNLVYSTAALQSSPASLAPSTRNGRISQAYRPKNNYRTAPSNKEYVVGSCLLMLLAQPGHYDRYPQSLTLRQHDSKSTRLQQYPVHGPLELSIGVASPIDDPSAMSEASPGSRPSEDFLKRSQRKSSLAGVAGTSTCVRRARAAPVPSSSPNWSI